MNRTIALERSLKILVPDTWSNDEKGSYLEKIAANLLKRQSYEITERISFTGMEIDLLGKHKPSSDPVYIECKFLSDAVNANVIDLMLGQAFRKKMTRLALFSAGPLTKGAKGALDDCVNDPRASFSFYGPDDLLEALVDSGTAPRLDEDSLPPTISHATLLVYPDFPYIWLLQEQMDGRPYRIVPYAQSTRYRPPPEAIGALLNKHQILEGLPVTEYLDTGNGLVTLPLTNTGVQDQVEVVGQISTAETILDYRPCRPEDFVGRLGLQKEIWDFLADVREGLTSTRLIALVGASGYGKSSLVSKLSARFRNKKWKNKYFLLPVDVRSARGPLFVAEALLQAIRSAAESGFLTSPDGLCVTDAENILASESISKLLAELKHERKILVVFFDQFEEILTKDELQPVFRVFRRFALDVQASQPNLVVGFSWRTGISFSDSNDAYQLWSELRDHRLTKTLGLFDSAEASSIVSQFEHALGTKLLPPLRRRLLEQGQGLPWFLKKLCIHLYRQIEGGVSQADLLGSRLNVQSLFDEDLDHLTELQLSCLRFIAANSPVDSLDVFERYENEVVSSLSDKRLIVRAGPRFAVYWDIFRDYLTEKKIPAIPWTYIPNCTLRMALSACEVLSSQGAISTANLARELAYSEATTINIITDLQNLAITGKRSNGEMLLLDGLDMASIADRVRSQFVEHIFYQQLLDYSDESNLLSRTIAIDLVRDLYSGADVKPKTRDNYLLRLIPWLEYAGLIELHGHNIQVYPSTKHAGSFGVSPHVGRSASGTVFLGSAPPNDTETLLHRLVTSGILTRQEIALERLKNPANDLSTLGLARWSSIGLIATSMVGSTSTPKEAFIHAVRGALTVTLLRKLIAEHPNVNRQKIGEMLSTELGRNWKSTSAVRYANGLYRYLDYLEQEV